MPDRQPSHDAPWAENLRHQTRPNQVSLALTRSSALETPRAEAPAATATRFDRPLSPQTPPQENEAERGYYDLSILKKPVWKWQIAGYFFFGGVSAGSHLLARLAERCGGDAYRDLTRWGAYISAAALAPCPPLLIHDLGDPKRFHHMLRVWKPATPMNLGTWTLVAFSGAVALSAAREYLREDGAARTRPALSRRQAPVLLAVHDAAGVPLALMMASYTGVLLSCTSNPLWCKNAWLGPLFSASAIATGAEAVTLALDGADARPDSPAKRALVKIDTLAHIVEFGAMQGYTRSLGEQARPLEQGAMKWHKRFATGALLASEALKCLPLTGRRKRWARVASAALGLASGFALRWAVVHGGQQAASDPRLARLATNAPRAEERRAISATPEQEP